METVVKKLILFFLFFLCLYFLQYWLLLRHTIALVTNVFVTNDNNTAESEYNIQSVPGNKETVSGSAETKLSMKMETLQPDQSYYTSMHVSGIKNYNTLFKVHHFARQSMLETIHCAELFKGDVAEISRAKRISRQKRVLKVESFHYISVTKNCGDFVKDRGYITKHLTEEERQFPIAFSILMYKYVEQFERLLRAIYRPQNVYCIHVDLKTSPDIYRAVSSIANCFKNVFVASKRISVRWGTMSVLEPEILCMKELWKWNITWKYFINLTGQEFPLRTNYELVKILKAYNGSNDVEGSRTRSSDRWRRAPKPPHGIAPTKGAVHVAVNRGYVDFLLHDRRSRDILAWVKRTKIPDEIFFSTLNHNPSLGVPGAYKGIPETSSLKDKSKPYLARFKNRKNNPLHRWPCQGKWVRGICIFGARDLPTLATRNELFANKFHLEYSPVAYSCMEELILNRTRDEYLGTLSFDASWYSTLGFVSNKVDNFD